LSEGKEGKLRGSNRNTHTHALSIVGNDQVLDLVTLRFDRYIFSCCCI